MKHNPNKSATNTDSCCEYTDYISPIYGYKYLGLIKDVEYKFKNTNFNNILDKIKSRVVKLCNTRLKGKNMFCGINEYALSRINYCVGIIDLKNEMLINQDREIRNIL